VRIRDEPLTPEDLSIEQLAGQRLMVGFDGPELTAEARTLIAELHVGGIILFSQNLETPGQITRLCHAAQEQAAACGLPPLFIAIDQEGGQVARLKEPFTLFEGNAAMTDISDAVHFGRVTAAELGDLGINMNMAPVVDVAFEAGSVMDQRAFGSDPAQVAEMGAAVIDTLQQHGIMAVAKHFPGIGRTTLDSHLDRPMLDTAWEELAASDLLPFEAAVRHDVSGIMLSHIVYRDRDPHWPASLSEQIARDVLRRRMGYDGLVMTDDLDMGAIRKYYDIDTAMRRVLAADIDLALICHRGPDIEQAWTVLRQRLEGSAELRQRGREAAERILTAKKKYLESRCG
jgi:beta-N-acetylhexosaminidase